MYFKFIVIFNIFNDRKKLGKPWSIRQRIFCCCYSGRGRPRLRFACGSEARLPGNDNNWWGGAVQYLWWGSWWAVRIWDDLRVELRQQVFMLPYAQRWKKTSSVHSFSKAAMKLICFSSTYNALNTHYNFEGRGISADIHSSLSSSEHKKYFVGHICGYFWEIYSIIKEICFAR